MSDVPPIPVSPRAKSEQGMLPFDREPVRVDTPSEGAQATHPAEAGRTVALRQLCEGFAHSLSVSLHEHLGTDVPIAVSAVDPISYHDFLSSLAEHTCLSIVRFDPPGAQGLLDLSPSAIFPIIDRLLGGRSHSPAPLPARGLTQIEQGFALHIIERAARSLADSWGKTPAGPIEVREEELFANPQQARIMPGNERVTVVRLDVSFSGCAGSIGLCVPALVTDLLVGPETSDSSLDRETQKVEPDPGPDAQALQKNIMQAAVELRALLAETKVRLSDVISMQIGDVITTDAPADGEVAVHLDGQEMLLGRLGQYRGTRAIQITRTRMEADAIAPKNDPPADGGPAGS